MEATGTNRGLIIRCLGHGCTAISRAAMLALERCIDIATRVRLHQHWTYTSDGISTDGPNLGNSVYSEGFHTNDAMFEVESCAKLSHLRRAE